MKKNVQHITAAATRTGICTYRIYSIYVEHTRMGKPPAAMRMLKQAWMQLLMLKKLFAQVAEKKQSTLRVKSRIKDSKIRGVAVFFKAKKRITINNTPVL